MSVISNKTKHYLQTTDVQLEKYLRYVTWVVREEVFIFAKDKNEFSVAISSTIQKISNAYFKISLLNGLLTLKCIMSQNGQTHF